MRWELICAARGWRLIAAWLCAVALWLAMACPATAEPVTTGEAITTAGFRPGSTCQAAGGPGTSLADVAATPARWTCEPNRWSIASERSFLRFDLRGRRAPADLITMPLTRFERMRVTAIGRDGAVASIEGGPGRMRPHTSDWLMSVPVPHLDQPLAAVVLQVDRPRNVSMLTDAYLAADGPVGASEIRIELVLAAICGMLIVPLFFNFAFYRVLRERFLLWHAAAVLSLLTHTIATTGLINHFVTLSIDQISILSATSWGLGMVAAAMFINGLIEPGMLTRANRLAIYAQAVWVPAWTVFYLFADGAARPFLLPLYHASFVPMMAVLAWAMFGARRRGSRAVYFQIAAWMPLYVIGAVRIVTTFGVTSTPVDGLLAQHISIALEVFIASLGVADRFLIIRRQRDSALAQAKVMEDRSERDPLTGLYNRSFIEDRFPGLFASGFRTMAVIDLDNFKQINDNYGHAAGDDVLRAVARALMPDESTLAVRMGGEEFALLLRGNEPVSRAERRRQAITARIIGEVPGLDRPVTASMGLVEHSARGRPAPEFTALYAHCDRLLYEAKRAGRNRILSEKFSEKAAEKSGAMVADLRDSSAAA